MVASNHISTRGGMPKPRFIQTKKIPVDWGEVQRIGRLYLMLCLVSICQPCAGRYIELLDRIPDA